MNQIIELGTRVNTAGGSDRYVLQKVAGKWQVWVVLDLNAQENPGQTSPVNEENWEAINLGTGTLAEAVREKMPSD